VTREPGALRLGRLVRAWREGRTGPLGPLLTSAEWAYRGGLIVREAAYRHGWLARERLPCPVVSVGNLTVGGTGKTPAVEMMARWLTEDGRRVAVLSRGYGRRPGASVELVSDGNGPKVTADRAGDEPFLLARHLRGVAIVVGSDRLAAGRWALRHLRPDILLLDDGFQQRRLLKDVEVVCVDARAPWGPGGLLPRGTLRESPAALARAHFLIVTRAGSTRSLAGLHDEIRFYRGPASWLMADYVVQGLEDLRSGERHPIESLRGRGVLAFAGIAAPERLAETLTAQGAIVRGLVAFPDHHVYGPRDIKAVVRRARAVGAGLLVTTEKDAVRLGFSDAARATSRPDLLRALADSLLLWALCVRLESVADPSVGAWRAALGARIDAAASATTA
jgi:tetraacyldisaccharide 4'-kinase